MGFNEFIGKLFGNKATRDMKEIKPWVDKIKAVYLREDALTIFQFCSFDSTFQFFYLLLFLSSRIRNVLL